MKRGLLLPTLVLLSFAVTSVTMARGYGTGGSTFGGTPPSGGFGYQGPQFGYQGPKFGDSHRSTDGTSGNRTSGTVSPPPDAGSVSRTPHKSGNQPELGQTTESRDSDY